MDAQRPHSRPQCLKGELIGHYWTVINMPAAVQEGCNAEVEAS